MKTHGCMMTIGLALAAILLTAPAGAQTVNLKANVPFDFATDHAMLKSGACSIQAIASGVVVLGDSDGTRVLVNLTPRDRRPADNSKMIFHRYGDQYFLTGIETETVAYKVHISKREMKLARKASPQELAVLAYAITPAAK